MTNEHIVHIASIDPVLLHLTDMSESLILDAFSMAFYHRYVQAIRRWEIVDVFEDGTCPGRILARVQERPPVAQAEEQAA
jgi:hypothetical protein